MARIRFDIAYKGAGFNGWQSQPDGSAIQDHFRKALETVLRVSDPWLVAASRTDAGVHAEMQVVAVDVPEPLPDLMKVRRSLNALLPGGVGVRSVEVVDPGFHPVYQSIAKVYRYRLWTGDWDNPFIDDQVWRIRQLNDANSFLGDLRTLVGHHDFSSFCAADSSAKTRDRTIHDIRLQVNGHLLDVWIQGSGFLKQMVRNIVGTAVDLDLGKLEAANSMAGILALKDRTKAGRTAPARGLSLVHIDFSSLTPLDRVVKDTDRGFKVAL
ncbi:tRNA pseudouridine(38-40) synthase TruA [bacterium]|nr:tRNA pseudouridine(38-40) synthase TruA [bacterium]